ncbi:MAG: hypothetical protein AAFO69_18770, partial [Bacteroidota bacterium]
RSREDNPTQATEASNQRYDHANGKPSRRLERILLIDQSGPSFGGLFFVGTQLGILSPNNLSF